MCTQMCLAALAKMLSIVSFAEDLEPLNETEMQDKVLSNSKYGRALRLLLWFFFIDSQEILEPCPNPLDLF